MKLILEERRKHQLIGLIVMVALGALFLPPLMKHSTDRLEEKINISVRLPDKPVQPNIEPPDEKTMFRAVKVAHVDIDNPPSKVTVPSEVHAQALSTDLPGPSKISPVQFSKNDFVKPAHKSVSKRTISHQKTQYAVQLGSFALERNAIALVARLRHKGFKANYTKSTYKQGAIYKVIVGQVTHREEAKILQQQLAKDVHLTGFIINTGVS